MKTWSNHGTVAGHFIETKERFISNTIRGLDYLNKYNFLPFDLKKTQEFIYSDVPEFEKYQSLEAPVTLEESKRIPYLDNNLFKNKIITGKEI